MTDHDVTDDDWRNAYKWARMAANNDADPADAPWKIVARIFLDTVAAPKTIAEELMDPDSYGEDTDGPYVVFDQARMMRIVKRVENLEEMVK